MYSFLRGKEVKRGSSLPLPPSTTLQTGREGATENWSLSSPPFTSHTLFRFFTSFHRFGSVLTYSGANLLESPFLLPLPLEKKRNGGKHFLPFSPTAVSDVPLTILFFPSPPHLFCIRLFSPSSTPGLSRLGKWRSRQVMKWAWLRLRVSQTYWSLLIPAAAHPTYPSFLKTGHFFLPSPPRL